MARFIRDAEICGYCSQLLVKGYDAGVADEARSDEIVVHITDASASDVVCLEEQ